MIKKHYAYKMYSRAGLYLGSLPRRQIVSDFAVSQTINTAGTQLQVRVGATMEQGGITVAQELVVDSAGFLLADSAGNNIISDQTYSFSEIPMDLANRMVVVMFYDGAPNGTTVFDGLITSWATDYKTNDMLITAISWGVRLQQYLVETNAGSAALSYDAANSEIAALGLNPADLTQQISFYQTFQMLSDTTISEVDIKMRVDTGSIPVIAQIFLGTPDAPGAYTGAYLNRQVDNTAAAFVPFSFSTPAVLLGGTTYTLAVYRNDISPNGKTLYLAADSTGAYANGTLYSAAVPQPGGYTNTNKDLSFKMITSTGGGGIGANYTSIDPSSIVRDLVDTFVRRGGPVTYDDTSVDDTSTVVSYDFKFDTLFDGIAKCVQLAPSNWYWYVDIGTNLLHFHRQGTTADHIFKMGLHLENLQPEYTLDDVKNTSYLSGADLGGGVNLLTLNTNPTSQRKYDVWLDKASDNRVSLTSTANILSNGILQQNANPVFRAIATIPAAAYDIETIHLGEMVGFANSNSLINGLMLQIVGLDKNSNLATLHLQTLPPALSHRVEDIKRNLDAVITVNNPATVT